MEQELDSDSDGGDEPYDELRRMKDRFDLTQVLYDQHKDTIQKAATANSVTNDTSNNSKIASSSTTARSRQNNLLNRLLYNHQPPRVQTNLSQHQPTTNQDSRTSDLLANQQQSNDESTGF